MRIFNYDTHLDIVTSNYWLKYNIGSGPYVEIVAGDFDDDNQYDVASDLVNWCI
ncbi:MAG: hypothetical protein MRQ13_04770 [Candidatus Midichloria sp.]|nr:hypothetical protein [Candidatus Midichloria sp.]